MGKASVFSYCLQFNVPALLLTNPPPPSLTRQSRHADSTKQQLESKLDFIFRVNEHRCGAKPTYGREVLDFLTFLSGPRPSPAARGSEGGWGRSGLGSCLFAQWQHKSNYWFQSRSVREAIQGIETRLELLTDMVDR